MREEAKLLELMTGLDSYSAKRVPALLEFADENGLELNYPSWSLSTKEGLELLAQTMARVPVARILIGPGAALAPNLDFCVALGDDSQFRASGFLVSEDVVVTAGHCFDANMTKKIYVGDQIGSGKEVLVKGTPERPNDYAGAPYFENDIGVLFLETKVEGVDIPRLASTNEFQATMEVREIGYGETDVKASGGYGVRRQTGLTPVGSCSQAQRLGSGVLCHSETDFIINAPVGKADACNGDSGGPLLSETAGKDVVVVGVISRHSGRTTTACGGGSVGVRVDKFLTWLDAVIAARKGSPRK